MLFEKERQDEEAERVSKGKLVEIGRDSNLVYDADTRIVYYKFLERVNTSMYPFMSPYYGENGLPCKYLDGKLIEVGAAPMRQNAQWISANGHQAELDANDAQLIEILLGTRLLCAVVSDDGSFAVPKGAIITQEVIDKAVACDMLLQLTLAAEL